MKSLPRRIIWATLLLLTAFNILGWLYLRNRNSVKFQSLKLIYPVKIQKGVKVVENDGYLLFYLPPDTPVYPSISGIVQAGSGGSRKVDPAQTFYFLSLENNEGYKLTYYFPSRIEVGTNVLADPSSNFILAETTSESLRFLENANLALSLSDKNGEKVLLTKKMFSERE